MKSVKSFIVTVLISVIASLVVVLVYDLIKVDKVAFVRTGVILQSFKGLKNAENQINEELKMVQDNIDTLQIRYENLKSLSQTSGKGNQLLKYQAETAYNEYLKYKETAYSQMEQRKNELIAEEINKINQIIESYGKKHGYKIILGSTNDGSILYGNVEYDITDQILEVVNKEQ